MVNNRGFSSPVKYFHLSLILFKQNFFQLGPTRVIVYIDLHWGHDVPEIFMSKFTAYKYGQLSTYRPSTKFVKSILISMMCFILKVTEGSYSYFIIHHWQKNLVKKSFYKINYGDINVNPLPPSDAVRKQKKIFLGISSVQYCHNLNKYHPSGNLKFTYLGIFKSLKFRILM